VKLVLSLDRGLKMIEERDCSEEDSELIQHLTNKSSGGSSSSSSSSSSTGTTDEESLPSRGMDYMKSTGEGEEQEEGEWDMDSMGRASTDSYVLFTVCDSQSTMEVQPRRGIFDSFMPQNHVEGTGDEDGDGDNPYSA
jgi:hypothetical protein